MLFTTNFSFVFALFMASTLLSPAAASPPLVRDNTYDAELLTWLATTDADVTFVGPKPGTLAARQSVGGNVNVVYCSTRTGNVCGGSCTVYNGPATCISSGLACLKASEDVSFCDKGGCGGSCHEYSSCGTVLNNGFCDTPGTKSITVPFI